MPPHPAMRIILVFSLFALSGVLPITDSIAEGDQVFYSKTSLRGAIVELPLYDCLPPPLEAGYWQNESDIAMLRFLAAEHLQSNDKLVHKLLHDKGCWCN